MDVIFTFLLYYFDIIKSLIFLNIMRSNVKISTLNTNNFKFQAYRFWLHSILPSVRGGNSFTYIAEKKIQVTSLLTSRKKRILGNSQQGKRWEMKPKYRTFAVLLSALTLIFIRFCNNTPSFILIITMYFIGQLYQNHTVLSYTKIIRFLNLSTTFFKIITIALFNN